MCMQSSIARTNACPSELLVHTPSLSDINTVLTDLKQQYNLATTKSNDVVVLSMQCRTRLQAMKWVDRMQKHIQKAKVNYGLAATIATEQTTSGEDDSQLMFDESDLWRLAKPRCVTSVSWWTRISGECDLHW